MFSDRKKYHPLIWPLIVLLRIVAVLVFIALVVGAGLVVTMFIIFAGLHLWDALTQASLSN